jgi:hypothetical protein
MMPLDDEIDDNGRPVGVPRPALAWQAAAACWLDLEGQAPVRFAVRIPHWIREAARHLFRVAR